jgi:glycosyltransferase involved in cell wall biosynthesis
MLKVVFITRSTLFTSKGGDTIQVVQTAKHLNDIGITTDIKLTNEKIKYDQYDLLHFFNIIRPADILYHIYKTNKPFVITPILVDYSGYDKYYRGGLPGMFFRFLSADGIEYVKSLARWIKRKDNIRSFSYFYQGHRRSINQVLKKTSFVLPNSDMEYQQLIKSYPVNIPFMNVPNGIDSNLFRLENGIEKDPRLVLCAARVEGIKNQLNLIRALNNTQYQLMIIGAPGSNQHNYYNHCKKIAAKNILFIDQLSQNDLVKYYQKAKVHILPGWFETCGLSSLEAAAMGCNIVITSKGFASEYFGNMAYYCDPRSPQSILRAIESASADEIKKELQEKIVDHFTWRHAAVKTAEAYKQVFAK